MFEPGDIVRSKHACKICGVNHTYRIRKENRRIKPLSSLTDQRRHKELIEFAACILGEVKVKCYYHRRENILVYAQNDPDYDFDVIFYMKKKRNEL